MHSFLFSFPFFPYIQVKFKLKINKNKVGPKTVVDGCDVDDDVQKQVSEHSFVFAGIIIIHYHFFSFRARYVQNK